MFQSGCYFKLRGSDSELEGPNSRQRGVVVGLDGDRGFTALKLKLISSIVAISGISLLRSFLKIGDGPLDEAALRWRVIIHLTFVTSGVLLALMDLVSSRSLRH
jgi:uncharacterized protein (TIGR00645 family)